MKFFKYSGAENLFLIALDSHLERLTPQIVQQICKEHTVDGALLLKSQKTDEFIWAFYNSDGSKAEMCGNAARCVAHLLKSKGLLVSRAQLHTAAGPVFLEVLPTGAVRVEMPSTEPGEKRRLKLGAEIYDGYFINTGVPHFVLTLENLDKATLETSRLLRHHRDFGLAGANITYVSQISNRGALAKTFERGVEGFTQACGTGAVAAAFYLQSINGGVKFEISMPGGLLVVELLDRKVYLSGPTQLLAEVDIQF